MLPQAVEYLKHQRPTKTKNKVIYDKPCYGKQMSLGYINGCWWYYTQNPAIMINTEKIDFLKHLINKLKS